MMRFWGFHEVITVAGCLFSVCWLSLTVMMAKSMSDYEVGTSLLSFMGLAPEDHSSEFTLDVLHSDHNICIDTYL